MPPPPPSPTYTIRTHSFPINYLFVSDDNERIYAGDMSGTVSVSSTRTLRPISIWKAHSDTILTAQEWNMAQAIITHGRDNKLHVWARITAIQSLGDAANQRESKLPEPVLQYSLDVNALNFCRFSLLPVQVSINGSPPPQIPSTSKLTADANHAVALLAIPNLVDSSLADIWELPSCKRIHAAIGKAQRNTGKSTPSLQESIIHGRGTKNDTEVGILMSLHVFIEGGHAQNGQLRLLCAYEIGSVALYRFNPSPQHQVATKVSEYGFEASIEGRGWDCMWRVRKHIETIMAMAVSVDNSMALTVSADHLVVRYSLKEPETSKSNLSSSESETANANSPQEGATDYMTRNLNTEDQRFVVYRIKQPGNAAITIRDDGRVCAVGGWDGKVRLYSTKTFKALGTLSYHTKSCQALAFARTKPTNPTGQSDAQGFTQTATLSSANTDDVDDELTPEELAARSVWLVCGSQDHRISVWELMSFEKAPAVQKTL